MPDPSITVDYPPTNGAVNRPFTATGTYVFDGPPPIHVVLKNAGGALIAIGNPMTVGDGNWSAGFDSPQPVPGATVFAEILGTTAQDSATNIFVS
ncbi:MAG: hypothetical protein L0241_13000 [Planctomycetia bacterium]|nr:hypothetical protein [Planctomycetia bacterium]